MIRYRSTSCLTKAPRDPNPHPVGGTGFTPCSLGLFQAVCVWVSGVNLISFISHHGETWPSLRKGCGGFDQFRLNAATSTCRLAQADFSASISLNQTWV